MLDVLLKIQDGRVHLHLVLPVVVSPLLLELKLRAIGRHQSVDEVDLDLIDVDDVGNVSTGRIEGKVAIDGTVVCRADLEGALDDLASTSAQSQRDRLLNHLQVALGEQLTVDVLDGLLGPVDKDDFQKDVIVMNLSNGFGIDRVRVASELVDLLVILTLHLACEV